MNEEDEETIRLHKIITGVTERSVWDMLVQRIPVASLAEHVPDEFFQWMKSVELRLNQEFTALEKACFRVLGQVNRTQPRKSQAEFILKHPNSGIVFRMLDDKPYRDLIWAQVKPEAVGMSTAT